MATQPQSQGPNLGKAAPGVYVQLTDLLASRHYARELRLFARQPARAQRLGEMRTHFRGRGIEFEEVRQYAPGDDIRALDWKVTARTGQAHTKLFREERERPVHLLVDQRSPMFFGSCQRFKSVLAAELAAALAWAALAGNDRVGGQVQGNSSSRDVRPRRSRHAVLQLLRDLVSLNEQLPGQAALQVRLATMLEDCRRATRPGTAIFILSDCHDFDADAQRALTLLARHTDVTVLQLLDALELALPDSGDLDVSDGQRRRHLQLDRRLSQRFQAQAQQAQQQLQQACRQAGARHLTVATDAEPRQLLSRWYGRGYSR